jgi:hypothetical protein
MFGSQALETAIGLALLFFVLASAVSAVVEGLSRLLQKRAKDLEATLRDMLSGTAGTTKKDAAATGALDIFQGTAVYTAAQAAARQGRWIGSARARPAYLSARSFADAVMELLADADKDLTGPGWAGLRTRLQTLDAEVTGSLLHAKAGLESWFDETMGRLSDAYKRWATTVLFVVGLLIAGFGNVSTIDVAQTLWQQPVARQAALNAAQQAATKTAPSASDSEAKNFVSGNVQSVQDLTDLGLPVGWQKPAEWSTPSWFWPHVAGWLITALLLMLGAPFWFDTLSRLVSLRTTGAKPPSAAQDDASATALRASVASSSGAEGLTALVTPPAGGQSPGEALLAKIRRPAPDARPGRRRRHRGT